MIQALSYTMDGVNNVTAISDGRTLLVDSPKNATQSFQYDDLYRLTRAQGSGYGAIDFQYDRIGNMTFKSSPAVPDPQHIDDPLINLGTMVCGGTGGTSSRGPRLPGEAPGPHAVTSTQSGLVYDYDDNGNMINHADGDVYSWDFKDRLISVQKGAVDTAYTYDYSGQRVIKNVNEGGAEKTNFYINKTFEIREDKAVKHVFSGSRRVARIETQSTDIGLPQQTLSFQPGWNFFSLNVGPDNPAIDAVLEDISGSFSEMWAYDPETQQYMGYVPAELISDLSEVHAQKGYVIRATSPVNLTVTGTPVSGDINLLPGWNLVPCPIDVPTPVDDALASIASQYEAAWGYDHGTGTWQNNMPDQYGFVSNLDTIEPEKAYWIKMDMPGRLSRQQQTETIHFFHSDHLGSSNVVTDADGAVVESTEFYPYGRPRYEESTGFDSEYKYTGKELDKESGLMYYEARYYEPVIGRFVSVDPLGMNPEEQSLDISQSLNLYAYALDNPLAYIDPTGLEPDKVIGTKAELFKQFPGIKKGTKQQLFEEAKIIERHQREAAIKISGSLHIEVNPLYAAQKADYNDLKDFNQVAPLRQEYIKEVVSLELKAFAMEEEGVSLEIIAKTLHAERRKIGEKYKDLTPEGLRKNIYVRNIKQYGDPLGPSIDYLRGKGKPWEDIIKSASKPSGKDIREHFKK
ncbi:MAG: hypothetical protein JRJ20_15995 [Deltaproteobacteria bacterium]|nr:hypothetical protein [Deltaproteobacteria bacterium]